MSNALEPTIAARRVIDQRQTYAADFGLIFRSSAVFYAIGGAGRTTTVSLMNYWAVKRAIDVSIVITTRALDGKVIERKLYNWGEAAVINHIVSLGEETEGSVEVEVFGGRNLVIPYPAIVAVYETANGISMVHSYARTYSPLEVEEGNTIEEGSESCATIRDSLSVQSFVVMHNGYENAPSQRVVAKISNHLGKTLEREYQLGEIKPHGTARINVREIFPEVVDFLEGQPGNFALKFRLSRAFTRLLVVNEAIDGTDLQVTHSNFNYADVQTNILNEHSVAQLCVANILDKEVHAVVYPDSEPAEYELTGVAGAAQFKSGERVVVPVTNSDRITVRRINGGLPSRIVTGLVGRNPDASVLPFECSLGVLHPAWPGKRSTWGILSAKPGHKSRLYAMISEQSHGPVPSDATAELLLFSAATPEPVAINLSPAEVLTLMQGGDPLEMFESQVSKPFPEEYYYFYLKTSYPGYFPYSYIENATGSATLEHAF